jgi:tetratricopeptide (TPR) repeat protein
VSAIRLAVPETAKSEYSKACGEFKKRKLADAEQHVRGAIQNYSKYLAAWVMLGQVLQEEQKIDEAHDACSQAITLDPTYLPPYLCLAQLLTLVNKWSDLLALSNRFLGMNRVGDRYSYYYRGLAHLNLQSLPEAQRDVLQAIAIDSEHRQYGLYFLLAQIYGEQGNAVEAAAQVRKFLKYSNTRENKDAATQYLAKLQSQRRETLQTGTPKVQAQLQSKQRPQSNEREQPKSNEQDRSDQSSQQDPVFLPPLPPPQSEQ